MMESQDDACSVSSAQNLCSSPTVAGVIDNASAVRVAPLSEFVTSPPDMFFCHLQAAEPQLKASISPVHPDDIIVCIEENMLSAHRLIFPENRGRVLKSRTVNQMNGLAYQLITRPLLMVVRVMYRVHRNDQWHYKIEHLAVLVNTKHPSIQPQLENGLKRGLRRICGGKKYAIELNFNSLVANWVKSVLYREHLLWMSSHHCGIIRKFLVSCEGANLIITNFCEYSYLCDVRSPNCCCLWVFCLPCCLLTCPSYVVTRQVLVDDIRVKIKGEACYWDLMEHHSPEEAVDHLRDILCAENTNWNRYFDIIRRNCNEERRRENALSSYEDVISSQPQSDDRDLPSYEQAILLTGKRNDALVLDDTLAEQSVSQI